MLDHVSIGVADIARSRRFYDAALRPLGATCLSADATSLGYGRETPALWVLAAKRPVPPDTESGLHICIGTGRRSDVDAFHAAALLAGGRDNGAPGPRPDYGP